MKFKNTKLREGDEVIVVSGKEKGKRGNIKTIVGEKCVINDLNLSKRHTRPNPQLGITGGIVEKEMPIHLSNVMIWNSSPLSIMVSNSIFAIFTIDELKPPHNPLSAVATIRRFFLLLPVPFKSFDDISFPSIVEERLDKTSTNFSE